MWSWMDGCYINAFWVEVGPDHSYLEEEKKTHSLIFTMMDVEWWS